MRLPPSPGTVTFESGEDTREMALIDEAACGGSAASNVLHLPAGLAVPLPPPSGTIAFELRENPGEVALVDETAHQSDVCQSEPVSQQQLASPFDFLLMSHW